MYSEKNTKDRLKRDLTLALIVVPLALLMVAVSHWREIWALLHSWWK